MNEFLDFISISLPTMLVSAANLLILYLILKKFLFGRVAKLVAAREREVAGLYSEAEQARSEGEQARSAYQARLEDAEAESRAAVGRAIDAADRRCERMYAAAAEDIARMKREADRDIALQRARALREAEEELADLSTEIAAQILAREVDEAAHREIVEDFLRNLETAR